MLMMFPQYRIATRRPSSSRLYHFERRKSAPGKKAASTKPRKKRVSRAPTKLEEYCQVVFSLLVMDILFGDAWQALVSGTYKSLNHPSHLSG